MNRFKAIFFLILFCASATFPQTTYYVSSSQGNDSNSGTSENAPFKSLSKVNGLNLKPGDKVLFKSGDVWEGQNLIIKDSGTESNRIVFSSYGSGEKPIITLREEVSGWKTASNWTKYSDNIWVINLPSSQVIQRLWINDKEVLFSNGINSDNMDGTGSGINSTHVFFHDQDNGKLYIFSNSNPAENYASIIYPGKIENGKAILLTVTFSDADNVTIEGLDIQGGMYASIGLGGSDYVTIENCNIGKYSNWTGISGNTGYAGSSDRTSDYIEISKCTIDSDWKYSYVFYTARTPYGVTAGNGASYWKIHDNYIKNWWMNIYLIAWDGVSLYHNVYKNEITAPDFSFAKGMQISGNIQSGTGSIIGAKVYNNYFHDLTHGIQVTSANNKFFYNIFKNFKISTNEHGGQSNSGWGIQIQTNSLETMIPDSNYIFNNTFYNLERKSITLAGNHAFIVNNIFANTNTQDVYHTQIQVEESTPQTWKNNLFFYVGYGINDWLISHRSISPYTVSEFNAINGQYNKTISGNIQFVGEISSLLNTNDFSLPLNSIARNAGIDVTPLLPESITNLIGNILNLTKPNIGAFNSQTENPTGLKIFLEGPYSNGSMSTKLNDEGLIPKSQPYNVSPWNYDGSESVSVVPKNIVDWILVELRNPLSPSKIVARQAAFLRNDGSITALDGVSKISFGSLIGTYYVVIKHRNHLAVRSSLPVLLVNGNLEYDFTAALNKAYGSNGLAKLDDGVYGMYGGDTDGDGVIDDKDISDVGSNLFKTGYQKEDVNLNSPVNVLDYKLPNENKSKSSQASSE